MCGGGAREVTPTSGCPLKICTKDLFVFANIFSSIKIIVSKKESE